MRDTTTDTTMQKVKMKTCSKCKVEKPLTDFNNLQASGDGKGSYCQPCAKEASRKWYIENPDEVREYSKKYRAENADKVRESNKKYYIKNADKIRASSLKYYFENADKFRDYSLRKKYGIGHEEYLELLEKQGGKCKVCGSTETDKNNKHFSVDHCHDTKKVRGLLCNKCNRGIGLLKDNPDLLRTAAKYIEEAHND